MFLVVVARTRFYSQENELFSGKIRVFLLVIEEPTKRNSVDKLVGRMEIKPIVSVNKDVIRTYMIQKIIPAIKEKWPKKYIGILIYSARQCKTTY